MSKELTFQDIAVGDIVICYDEYIHDYIEHKVTILSIEYDAENATPTNPSGKVCFCEDEGDWGDDYIGAVYESNFVCIDTVAADYTPV